MQTGKNFWQLVGMVFFILIAYGLMELSDSIAAGGKQLEAQRKLLSRQKTLLRDNHWPENLHAADQARKAWMRYLPLEKSATFAKARLLSEMRLIAKDSGIANLTVTATEVEEGNDASERTGNKVGSGYAAGPVARFGKNKNDDRLPAGVHMIKLTVSGRFDSAGFYKLLQKQEDAQRFSVVERITVRGTQLELGIRCYWRLETNSGAGTAKPIVTSIRHAERSDS
jgi:hypothetical protein